MLLLQRIFADANCFICVFLIESMNKKEYLPIGIMLLVIAISVYLYPILPDQVPTHWNAAGDVDGYSSKLFHVTMFPALIILIAGLFHIIPRIGVFRKNIEAFMEYFYVMKVTVLAFFLYLYVITTLPNFGIGISMNFAIMPAVGFLFIIIGYMMKFAKRNFFVGIRTPWALASDKVWKKTHELGSKLFMVIGIWMFFVAFLPPKFVIWALLIPIIVFVFWMYAYSYFEWKKEGRRNELE